MTSILTGKAETQLRKIAANSVDACVTSPPYYGLRDYGCKGQIGLEKTPELFIARLVSVFREVRRVLKDDAVLWVNMGDSYATGAGKACSPGGGKQGEGFTGPRGYRGAHQDSPKHALGPDEKNSNAAIPTFQPNRMPLPGLKPKDLIGIPWMLAFALRADGWYLRSDVIWHKSNPMPESVTDRPTKSHEYLFLLSKSRTYFYDADAIREPLQADTRARYARGRSSDHKYSDGGPGNQTIARTFEGQVGREGPNSRMHQDRDPSHLKYSSGNKQRRIADGKTRSRLNTHLGSGVPREDNGSGRNRRTVWTVASAPFKEAHFATFPPKLIEPCILASRQGGVILDPFSGAGTTGLVALEHGRSYIGIELNPRYVAMQRERLAAAVQRLAA